MRMRFLVGHIALFCPVVFLCQKVRLLSGVRVRNSHKKHKTFLYLPGHYAVYTYFSGCKAERLLPVVYPTA